MATSGSYDDNTTLHTLLRDSYALINVWDDKEPLEADMYVNGRRILNQLCAHLAIAHGMWLLNEVSVTLTPGTESYTIGVSQTVNAPKPMQVPSARRIMSDGTEIPIEVVSRDEYFAIPDKDLQAVCNTIYYHPGNTTGTLYVWPTGTATEATIEITSKRPIQDFDVQGDNPDIPEEWYLFLQYKLAETLAPKYLGGKIPPDIIMKARELGAQVYNFDEERTPLQMQPI